MPSIKRIESQCDFVTRQGMGGYLCCSRHKGHRGPHITVYDESREWMTRADWKAKHGHEIDRLYRLPPGRRRKGGK